MRRQLTLPVTNVQYGQQLTVIDLIQVGNETLKIPLKKTVKWNWIIVFGASMQMVLILAFASLFAYAASFAFDSHLIFGIVACIPSLFFLYLIKKIIGKNFIWEKIFVDKEKLIIIILSPVSIKRTKILLEEIEYFGSANPEFYNDEHTPFIDTYVYQTSALSPIRKRIMLAEGGSMVIRTSSSIYIFGNSVTSWDAEDAVRKVEMHTERFFKR